MATALKTVCLWLGSIAIAALGCEADGITEQGEATWNDVADGEESADPGQEENLAESGQPLIESGQSLILTQSGKCLAAPSRNRLTLQLHRCRTDWLDDERLRRRIPARLAWTFEADGRIRSAAFPDRCVTLPTVMGGAVGLAPCSALADEQQDFTLAPADGDEGKICSTVQIPPSIKVCLTHNGRRLVYSTFQPAAALWRRFDAP